MADTQQYKCSTCKCHRLESAFKVNRKGSRLKTCLGCNERKKRPRAIVPNEGPVLCGGHADVSGRIDVYETDDGVLSLQSTLTGCDDDKHAQLLAMFKIAAPDWH